MKAMRYLALTPIAALALAGCGGSTGNSNTSGSSSAASGDCSKPDVFCVGLVTDTGKIDDKSFNQSAWEGVEAGGKATGAQVKDIETVSTNDYATNIKQFTDKKYDVIVTVGFLMADATVKAAAQYPDTKFIGVDQFIDTSKVKSPNLTGLSFNEDQAGYAAGYLAGLMTKTNKIGDVLGQEIPPVQKYDKGYKAGALAANPKVKVTSVYHPAGDNAFQDPVWGAGEAKKQLAQGVDIVFGAGGSTGNGAIQETAKASGAGKTVFCIGVDVDQWDSVPAAQPCLITSAEKHLSQGVTDLIKQAKDGSIKGGNFIGTAGVSPYHAFDSSVPADVKTKVADVVAKLANGSLKTGVTL